MLTPDIFRAYDVRGLVPAEFDEDGAYRIGQSLVRYTGAKRVIVAGDARTSTPVLKAALIRGVTSQGAAVVDVGTLTTPMFYFAVGKLGGEDAAGAMITASHNPPEYNGVKLTRGDVSPIGGETGLFEVRDDAMRGPYPDAADANPAALEAANVLQPYLDMLTAAVPPNSVPECTIVVDGGAGVAGTVVPEVLERYPQVRMTGLCMAPGGAQLHEANPLKEETLAHLQEAVRTTGAVAGFAFDGDADRIGAVDERGVPLRGDTLTALLAAEVLAAKPGATVMYDVRSGWPVPEAITAAGGKAEMVPVGHGRIKPRMRDAHAAFAGELSFHFYFGGLHRCECSDLVLLMLLQRMKREGKTLSELAAPLCTQGHSGEVNFRVEDVDVVLNEIDAKFRASATETIRIDGVRMEFRDPARPESDWWLSVRASNTEPLLRVSVGTRTAADLDARLLEVTSVVRRA